MLNSFKFNDAKCKITCGLALGRIKLIKNKRNLQIKQYRKEIAELLRTGRQDYARIRVEAIIRESLTLTALEVLELYLELLNVRAPLVTKTKEIPRDMVEAISSIIYAASRLADLPELTTLHKMFAVKYGKEYVTEAASDVTCGRWMVNENLRRCLTVEPPEPALKLEALSDIAQEFNVEWDLDRARRELMPETAGVSGFGYGGAIYTDASGAANAHAAYVQPNSNGRNQGGGGGGGGSPFVSAHLPMSPLPTQQQQQGQGQGQQQLQQGQGQQQQQQQQQGGPRAYADAQAAAAAAAASAADARHAADYAARFAGSNNDRAGGGAPQPPNAGAGAGNPGGGGPQGGQGEFGGGDGGSWRPPTGWLGGPNAPPSGGQAAAAGAGAGSNNGNAGGPPAAFVPRSEEDIRRAYEAAQGPPPKPGTTGAAPAPASTGLGPNVPFGSAGGGGASAPLGSGVDGGGAGGVDGGSGSAGLPSAPAAPPAAGHGGAGGGGGGDSEFDELQKRFDALKRGGL